MAARVTIHKDASAEAQTPSAELVQNALQAETIDGPRGKKFLMRKPSPLAQFRIAEALGALASNQAYMEMVTPLLWLGAIDGDPVALPTSKLELEALIQRLDDDGMTHIMFWFVEKVVGPMNDRVSAILKAEQQKALLKN